MLVGHYVMTISRMTVDKLGVKLYDRVSAVIAELVANGYDADATEVTIEAPMGVWVASTVAGKLRDNGYSIIVRDNGTGIDPEAVNPHYLKVGGERRKDPARGDRSKVLKRRVMGRKGVGKLAPFGICGTIEVVTSGGGQVQGPSAEGKTIRGYRTAHFIMRRADIMTDADADYEPEVGKLDGTISKTTGTTLVLSDFIRRQVPEMPDFSRQMAQRFGLASKDWRILLVDSQKAEGTDGREALVGDFPIDTTDNTLIRFVGSGTDPETLAVERSRVGEYRALAADQTELTGLSAGFLHSDDMFYPVTGWVALAKQAYRDDLMAGVRIYCRGKIAAQTGLFNRPAGFTGEFTARSYFVGELHADWLDETEDLIQTDRRDILWSDELGQAFEKWGQDIVARVGVQGREPMKKGTWERFQEATDIRTKVAAAFPGDRWKSVRESTIKIAKSFGERLSPGELGNGEQLEDLVQLSLMLGPHVDLDERLQEAAADGAGPLRVVARILRTARVAELSSYGMIADKRIKVIDRITQLKDEAETLEDALQSSIEQAPWLINPQWSPISANQTLETLRSEFVKFYKQQTGGSLNLQPFEKSAKRPDFVLSSQDGKLQIIEIKRPKHSLTNTEWDRIQTYIDTLTDFFAKPGHEPMKAFFPDFRVTLVCDDIRLTGVHRTAFGAFKENGKVEHITWMSFLARTRETHKEFLQEAERQKRLALAP